MESYLKKFRKSKEMTTAEVANALVVSSGYYNKIENLTRTPSQEMLIKLAEIFDVHPDVLRRDYELNRAYMNASNHWIGKIKVKDMTALEAYKKEHFFERYNLPNDELISKFINFVALEIRDSLKSELDNNNNFLKFFVLEKLKSKKLLDSN